MKLRNKKTGEIIDIYKGQILLHCNQGRKTIHFKSLKELEEWEDYEEPKDYWYINADGDVIRAVYKSDDLKRSLIAIGNYFETLEEAVKAVEKLEAWKRLKDKGFRFKGNDVINDELVIKYDFNNNEADLDGCTRALQDVIFLFGGEQC